MRMIMTCPDCGNMIAYNSYFSSFYCPRCGGIFKKVKPMTNADRIRAMTDEELAILLNKIVVNHHIKNSDNCNHCPMKGAEPCDTEGIIDWLKQHEE